jgi:hypothetical protein
VAPCSDAVRHAAYVSQAAEVATESIEGTDVAAVGVDSFEVRRLAQPEGAKTIGIVNPSAADTEPIAPPTVTAQELTHTIISIPQE